MSRIAQRGQHDVHLAHNGARVYRRYQAVCVCGWRSRMYVGLGVATQAGTEHVMQPATITTNSRSEGAR